MTEQMNKTDQTERVDEQGARYSVGIDLGTTHSVISYVDNESDELELMHEVLEVPQLTAAGQVETLSQLPSFIYRAHENELAGDTLALPWNDAPSALVGSLARTMGSKTPLRLVSSAKSWLCHGEVNCREPFLPLDAPEDVEKISPFQASKYYLEHIKAAWDYAHADYPLAEQDLVITIPASFDPAARELTVEAAREIGLDRVTLLEEPQAAVYSWIKQSGKNWRDQVSTGDIILVVDVGGGTTDLSLVAVVEEEGALELKRIAVGDHILLGGDNMDLALAYRLQVKLSETGKRLQPWQVLGLTHACRNAKEQMLSDPEIESVPVVVPSRGSKLMASTLKTELTREDVESTLLDGFFPMVEAHERPAKATRGALQTLGLQYATDAGITRHLAAFLGKHKEALNNLDGFDAQEGDFIRPTAILLNGGVLKSTLLANRVLGVINNWVTIAEGDSARLLDGMDLDLAVAKGASYYGNVRRGSGVRIRGGVASSYYVGVESAMPAVPGMPPQVQALCVAPFGMEEGVEADLAGHEFGLVVGEPVRFRFFGSNIRREDQVGALLDYWEPDHLEELPDIEVSLPADGDRNPGEIVPVKLSARVTEVGTLELEAISTNSDEHWKISFEVRQK